MDASRLTRSCGSQVESNGRAVVCGTHSVYEQVFDATRYQRALTRSVSEVTRSDTQRRGVSALSRRCGARWQEQL